MEMLIDHESDWSYQPFTERLLTVDTPQMKTLPSTKLGRLDRFLIGEGEGVQRK